MKYYFLIVNYWGTLTSKETEVTWITFRPPASSSIIRNCFWRGLDHCNKWLVIYQLSASASWHATHLKWPDPIFPSIIAIATAAQDFISRWSSCTNKLKPTMKYYFLIVNYWGTLTSKESEVTWITFRPPASSSIIRNCFWRGLDHCNKWLVIYRLSPSASWHAAHLKWPDPIFPTIIAIATAAQDFISRWSSCRKTQLTWTKCWQSPQYRKRFGRLCGAGMITHIGGHSPAALLGANWIHSSYGGHTSH